MAIDQVTTAVIKDDAVTAAKIVAGAVVADVAAEGWRALCRWNGWGRRIYLTISGPVRIAVTTNPNEIA